MATHIKADGTEAVIKPGTGKEFTVDELQKLVGGYFELLRLPGGKYMAVNEDGKLRSLPVNHKASVIYGHDVILGDAVILGKGEIS